MNKKLTTADRFPQRECSYIAPQTTVADIYNEGVLCTSPNGSHEPWGEEDLW